MKCENCGKDFDKLYIIECYDDGYCGDLNNLDGLDYYAYKKYKHSVTAYFPKEFIESKNNKIHFYSNDDWEGYYMNDNERYKTVKCPHCDKYPFENKCIIKSKEKFKKNSSDPFEITARFTCFGKNEEVYKKE